MWDFTRIWPEDRIFGLQADWTALKEKNWKNELTIFWSELVWHQIQQICDRVGIFVNGNLIACGRIEDLGQQIQKENHYSLELKVSPCDDKVLAQISNQPGVEKIEKNGEIFMVQSNRDIRGALTEFLGKNGYTILHLHQRGGDLDEIYRLYFEKAGQNDEERLLYWWSFPWELPLER